MTCEHPILQREVVPLTGTTTPGQPQTYAEWAADHHPNGQPRYRTMWTCRACGYTETK